MVSGTIETYDARQTEEQLDQVLRTRVNLAAQEALRHGVTSFHDAGVPFETILNTAAFLDCP